MTIAALFHAWFWIFRGCEHGTSRKVEQSCFPFLSLYLFAKRVRERCSSTRSERREAESTCRQVGSAGILTCISYSVVLDGMVWYGMVLDCTKYPNICHDNQNLCRLWHGMVLKQILKVKWIKGYIWESKTMFHGGHCGQAQ